MNAEKYTQKSMEAIREAQQLVIRNGNPQIDQQHLLLALVNQEGGVAFAMYPTAMSELFAVADEHRLMPPKSTWFEPKLRSGILIHRI